MMRHYLGRPKWAAFYIIAVLFPLTAAAQTRIALTVDDLPVHGDLPSGYSRLDVAKQMLTVFEEEKIHGIYGFINAGGLNTDMSLRQVLQLWQSRGQRLGNHTYSHMDLNSASISEFKSDIDKNEPFLQQLSNGTDWKYFRYPYLHEGNSLKKRRAVRAYLKSKKYQLAPVTIPFEDYAWNNPYARCLAKGDQKAIQWLKVSFIQNALAGLERAEKLSQLLFNRPMAHILLLHIGGLEAEVLSDLIRALKARNVQFISLAEAVKDSAYGIDPDLAFTSGGFFLSQVMKSRNLSNKDFGLPPLENYPGAKLNSICR